MEKKRNIVKLPPSTCVYLYLSLSLIHSLWVSLSFFSHIQTPWEGGEADLGSIPHPSTKTTSTSGTTMEIQKFNGKNVPLRMEMMQDVLIIRRQVEAIHHNNKPTSMTTEEWRSLNEIARSTIQMHLAENVY